MAWFFPTLLIGVSLSMDAFAVSVSSGISIPGLRPFHALRSSFFFGLFQFLMPVAGWFLGSSFATFIDAFDHWVVFALLTFIGGKMALESWRKGRPAGGPQDQATESAGAGIVEGGGTAGGAGAVEDGGALKSAGTTADIRSLRTLLTISVATSIDALAVGVSFSLLNQDIWINALIIGGVTFCVCFLGFEFGRRLGRLFEKWAGLAGGLTLIGVGAKILLEHLMGGT